MVEAGDAALVFLAELVEPDISVLGDHDDIWHPVAVGAEALRFIIKPAVGWHWNRAGAEKGQLAFFFDEIKPAEQAIEVASDQLGPVGADVLKLGKERMGGSNGWAAQHRDQVLILRPEMGLGIEECVEMLHDAEIGALGGQIKIIKQIQVGGQSGVLVGNPQNEHLFERYRAVRMTIFADASKEVCDGLLLLIDRHRRELGKKAFQGVIQLLFSDLVSKKYKGIFHCLGIDPLAIAGDDEMEDFVDEAHGVDLPGFDGALWVFEQVALLVHLLGQAAGSVEIGQDNIAAEGINGLVELVALAGLTGDVEFHVVYPGVCAGEFLLILLYS